VENVNFSYAAQSVHKLKQNIYTWFRERIYIADEYEDNLLKGTTILKLNLNPILNPCKIFGESSDA
jgi:hypothetical protein